MSTPSTPTVQIESTPLLLPLKDAQSLAAQAVQGLLAGVSAGLVEAGVVLRGARLPIGGKVGMVAAAAAAASPLGRLASSYVDQDAAGDPYPILRNTYIIDAVSAGLVAAIVSMLLNRESVKLSATSRGLIVAVAVGLTGVTTSRLLPYLPSIQV